MQSLYAIGFVRGSRTHYLKTRETNFRRACKTARSMLKDNKRYKIVTVSSVIINSITGVEYNMEELYRKVKK